MNPSRGADGYSLNLAPFGFMPADRYALPRRPDFEFRALLVRLGEINNEVTMSAIVIRRSIRVTWLVILLVAVGAGLKFRADAQAPPAVIGRWDVTVRGKDGSYPSWFEVHQSGFRTLVGSYVGQFGSARPIAEVKFDNGSIRFVVPPQWERRQTDVVYEGRLEGEVIRGTTTNDDGDPIQWEARRAPALKRERSGSWGDSVELINGRDLAGWKPQ